MNTLKITQRFRNIFLLVAIILHGTAAIAGCDASGPVAPPETGSVITEVTVGVGRVCDWQLLNSCGDGLQCDRISDEGTSLEEGVCMVTQAAPCDEGMYRDFCGRALSCQWSDKHETSICLPNTCINDSECPTGKICANTLTESVCVTPVTGCGAL